MKKLFYFHGLQSKQGCEKVGFLTRNFIVHAPIMVYKQPATWPVTDKKVKDVKPEIMVGSSMGGLMCFYTAYNQNSFDRIQSYIDGWKCDGNLQKAQIQIILGKNDQDVDPNFTLKYLQDNKIKANITYLDIGHRITYQVFTEQFQNFAKIHNLC